MHSPLLFNLIDGANQALVVRGDDIAVYSIGADVCARTAQHPQIVFKVVSYSLNDAAAVPVTVELFKTDANLADIYRFVPQRFSLYTHKAYNRLEWKRNLDFDTNLLQWIHKVPGRYVMFTEDSVEACDILSGGQRLHVAARDVALSHLCPEAAWF